MHWLLEWKPKVDNDDLYNARRAYWKRTDANGDAFIDRNELHATLPHRVQVRASAD